MKFQKINDKVIRCVISREELNSRGIDIDDLMDNRGKAEEFLRYVLNQARFEVDYQTSGDILNVQMSVMHDGEISMMISEDHNAAIRAVAEQFHKKITEFQAVLEQAKKAAAEENRITDKTKEKVIKSLLDHTKDSEEIEFDFWTKLSSIEQCIEISFALSDLEDTVSDLYKYNGSYYINISVFIQKSMIAKNVFIMSEFSESLNAQPSPSFVIKEHGDLIIKGDALSVLRELA